MNQEQFNVWRSGLPDSAKQATGNAIGQHLSSPRDRQKRLMYSDPSGFMPIAIVTEIKEPLPGYPVLFAWIYPAEQWGYEPMIDYTVAPYRATVELVEGDGEGLGKITFH